MSTLKLYLVSVNTDFIQVLNQSCYLQIDEKILALRYPRYIQPDKILRPYNSTQSEGKCSFCSGLCS